MKAGTKTGDSINIMASNGITSGKANGTYGVNDYVTRTHLQIFIDHSKKFVK